MPQKCHKVDNQEAFTGLFICSYRDKLKDHSTSDSWLPSQQKEPNNNLPPCQQQGDIAFLGSLSISRGSFFFLFNKSYFVCWPCCLMSQSTALRANSLACESKNSRHWPAMMSIINNSSWGYKIKNQGSDKFGFLVRVGLYFQDGACGILYRIGTLCPYMIHARRTRMSLMLFGVSFIGP
jgi:hypothetical protein